MKGFSIIGLLILAGLIVVGCGQRPATELIPPTITPEQMFGQAMDTPAGMAATTPDQMADQATNTPAGVQTTTPEPTKTLAIQSPTATLESLLVNPATPTGQILITLAPSQAAPAEAPTATPTTASLVTVLKDQLVLAGIPSENFIQLGIVKGCPKWDEVVTGLGAEPKLPYLHNTGRNDDRGQLCLYGFLPGSSLLVELRSPDGEFTHNARMILEALSDKISVLRQEQPVIDEEAGFSAAPDGTQVFSLRLWWPAGLPTGAWHLSVQNEQGQVAEGVFEVDAYTPQPAIGLTKPHAGPYAAKANPFKRPAVEEGCQVVSPGQNLPIYVVNLPPGSAAHLGVYQLIQTSANLVDTLPFKVNQKGNQQIDFTIPANWPVGRYYIVLPLDAEAVQLNQAGPAVCVQINEQQ